jgi:hypothetical protein
LVVPLIYPEDFGAVKQRARVQPPGGDRTGLF